MNNFFSRKAVLAVIRIALMSQGELSFKIFPLVWLRHLGWNRDKIGSSLINLDQVGSNWN